MKSVEETPEEEPEKLISEKDIIERLNILDSARRRKLLITAAQSHLDVLRAVKAETNAIYEDARSSTLYFHRASIAVYSLTHCRNLGDSLPKAFETNQADSVISEILRHLKNIQRDSPQYASFATRQNALVALGEMCRYINGANTPVGKEVIMHFKEDSSLDRVMQDIVGELTTEERKFFKSRAKGKNWLLETDKLAQEARKLDLFPGLGWIVARIGGLEYRWQDEERKKRDAKERARYRKGLRSFNRSRLRP